MSSDLLGVATCDECGVRIKVLKKHEGLIGKSVRCPKCRALITLALDSASANEQAAIESHEKRQAETKRTRRTKDQIRDEHVAIAKDGFQKLHARLRDISETPKSSEEQVRLWCVDALRYALGYNDSEIDTECRVLGGRVDIAIKSNERILIVIECKNVRMSLKSNVRDQAGMYAATLSADWAVVTNGDIWKLYRVCPKGGHVPHLELVFDVSLLDEDGISETDAQNLYLLTSRAMNSGDTEREFHSVSCKRPSRLFDAMYSERVIKAMRLELAQAYEAELGVKVSLDDSELKEAMTDAFEPSDL